jgi:glutamate/tyrosine decarboxylase-like PLP-dependent enzyme
MTELEMKMTDWIATAIGLPDFFKNSDPGQGGGIIQCTASDSTFVAILAARARAVMNLKSNPLENLSDMVRNADLTTFEHHNGKFFESLVAYTSEQV